MHVWPTDDGKFEIAHESASGGSWGFFQEFPIASEAVAAAHRLNRKELGGLCDVDARPAVLAAIPAGASFQPREW